MSIGTVHSARADSLLGPDDDVRRLPQGGRRRVCRARRPGFRGCVLAPEPDPTLLAAEPDDIHRLYPL